MEKLLTFDKKKNKYVTCGYLDGDVFKKNVKSCHFMRISQSYGIDENVMQKLMEKGCKFTEIILPTHKLCNAFLDWFEPDIKVQDFGHGKQRFMPVKRMYKGIL